MDREYYSEAIKHFEEVREKFPLSPYAVLALLRMAESQYLEKNYIEAQYNFDNFRRRAHKDRQDVIQYGHENLVKDLLSTVDNLDRAIEHAHQSDGGDLASLLQGVELVQRELYAVLAQHEVHVIDAEGSQFDPSLHEAMAHVQDDSAPPNSVIEVLQKGYQLRDRLLRGVPEGRTNCVCSSSRPRRSPAGTFRCSIR